MILESAQLLCNAHPKGATPYRHTHVHHPCSLWVQASLSNYRWLVAHARALSEEYSRRYDNKVHACVPVIDWCAQHEPSNIPDIGLTPFARAIKQPWFDETKDMDVVSAYRTYYIGDKQRFAKWAPRAQAPSWWPDPLA